MVQKWMQTFVLLFFCQGILQQISATTKTDGESVPITCVPSPKGTMVIWFRVKENAGMEFIGSFNSNDGKPKRPNSSDVFSYKEMHKNILIINSFQKARDSGAYGCASINKNMLVFGEVTRLAGKGSPTTTTTTASTTTAEVLSNSTTAKACPVGKAGPEKLCNLIIWGPLAVGCGLLFLILLITISYCNRTRTKRCPHHYKREKRIAAHGK